MRFALILSSRLIISRFTNFAGDNMNYGREIEKLNRKNQMRLIRNGFFNRHGRMLHPGQLPIIGVIYDNEGNTQSEIAEILGVSGATVGMSIKRLELAGLVIKKQDENDGRTTRIELTAEGTRCAKEAKNYLEEMIRTKYDGFSEEELRRFYEFVLRTNDNLEKNYNK